jgi:hypothetical protein
MPDRVHMIRRESGQSGPGGAGLLAAPRLSRLMQESPFGWLDQPERNDWSEPADMQTAFPKEGRSRMIIYEARAWR